MWERIKETSRRTSLARNMIYSNLKQRSPNFLAPGTSFTEDNFSTDGVGGEERGDGSGSNASDRGDGSGGNTSGEELQMKLCWLSCCLPPALRPGT